MSLHIQISGLNGQGLYSPNSINEMETLIGGKVVLLKEPKPQLGLGGIVNVFRTAKLLNIHLDIGDKDDTWGFLIIPDETLRVNGLKSFEREALWQIRRSYTDYSLWSKEDYDDTVKFFTELTNEAGWPSKQATPLAQVATIMSK